MAETVDATESSQPGKNDLVIRDGFPALKHRDGGRPLIEGDEPVPRVPFASYSEALFIEPMHMESIKDDSGKVFTARAKEEDAAYSAGTTYFIPSVMKPRCALEALALRIFQAHAKGIEGMYIPEQSGAEWWTLVMDAAAPDDDEEESDEVGIHFDADYGLEAEVPDLLLHPRVATVTYLSNVGAPTLILDRKTPAAHDAEKKSLGGQVKKGWLSGPRQGKHVAFDGRLLHGAPASFFPGVDFQKPESEPDAKRQKIEPAKRITFLVNCWFNHCPLEAELLDDDVVEQLQTPWEEPPDDAKTGNAKGDESYVRPFDWKCSDLSKSDKLDCVELSSSEDDPAGSEETVICDRKVIISYNENTRKQHDVAKKCCSSGSSLELNFNNGALTVEVGEEVKEDDDEQ